MPNSASRTPRDSWFIQREIQEIRNALEAFKAAFEKGRAVELLLILLKACTISRRPWLRYLGVSRRHTRHKQNET